MTVQELIDALSLIEDKSVNVETETGYIVERVVGIMGRDEILLVTGDE